jgi:hypothetical protein
MLGWTFSVAVGLHYYEIIPYLWTGVFEREFTRSLLRNRVSFSVENCSSEPQKVREYISWDCRVHARRNEGEKQKGRARYDFSLAWLETD